MPRNVWIPADTVLGQVGDVDDIRLDTREFCVLSITAAGWHSGALVLPVTDHLRTGTEPKKREGNEIFPPIHNGGYYPPWEGEISGFDAGHELREFDASNLRRPRIGHRGIRGISTVARGMKGGLRGGFYGSGVVRSGADESMRRGTFGAVTLGEEGWEGGNNGEISRDTKSGLEGSKGMGARGGHVSLGRGRQLKGETAEAGERLGESIRIAVRGDKRGPTK